MEYMNWFDTILMILAAIGGIKATIELCGIILLTINIKSLAILALCVVIPTLWFCIYHVVELLPL